MPTDKPAMPDPKPNVPRGLLAAVGAIEEGDEFDDMVEEIYRQRRLPEDRPVNLDDLP